MARSLQVIIDCFFHCIDCDVLKFGSILTTLAKVFMDIFIF